MANFKLPKATTDILRQNIPADGQLIFDTVKKCITIGDGITSGGINTVTQNKIIIIQQFLQPKFKFEETRLSRNALK